MYTNNNMNILAIQYSNNINIDGLKSITNDTFWPWTLFLLARPIRWILEIHVLPALNKTTAWNSDKSTPSSNTLLPTIILYPSCKAALTSSVVPDRVSNFSLPFLFGSFLEGSARGTFFPKKVPLAY